MAPETVAAAVFGPKGPLAGALPSYTPREPQLRMVAEVERTIHEGGISLIEAPTGVGKSFAYLVPALLSPLKVVVSTAYKGLQDQLIDKDIPFLLEALNLDSSIEVAKGRSNYLCHYKLEAMQGDQSLLALARGDDEVALDEIELKLTDPTFKGDIAYLNQRPSRAIERDVVSLPMDCLGRACQYAESPCYVDSMRRRAQEANLVITNHDLLLYSLKDAVVSGQHDLVPEADVYILDEAHHLEDIATRVLASELSVGEISTLLNARMFRSIYQLLGPKRNELEATCRALMLEAAQSADRDNVVHPILEQALNLADELDAAANDLQQSGPKGEVAFQIRQEASAVHELAVAALEQLAQIARDMAEPDPGYVRFLTPDSRPNSDRTVLNRAPLLPAALLDELLFSMGKTIVCTSATLTNNQTFLNYRMRSGLLEHAVAETLLPNVFDYKRQALLFLPQIKHFDWRQRERWYESIKPIISDMVDLTRGDTLCLFTSFASLREVYADLQEKAHNQIWEVRSQEEGNPSELIQWLKETPHSVLCATRSYWEGVDIPGDAVISVIIDKLPFVPPGDPVNKHRVALLNDIYGEGNEWWAWDNYVLPAVSLALKQGFGRLIRRHADRGIVTILDSRLTTKRYGLQIRSDLPPAQPVLYFEQVREFFAQNVPND